MYLVLPRMANIVLLWWTTLHKERERESWLKGFRLARGLGGGAMAWWLPNKYVQRLKRQQTTTVLSNPISMFGPKKVEFYWICPIQNFASFVSGQTNVSCQNEKAWELGATFFNYLNSVSIEGITGKIRFQVSWTIFD